MEKSGEAGMGPGGRVVCTFEGSIGFITLARPEKLNAQDARMCDELLLALRELAAAPEIRAAVFRGEGRAFCSGHDLSEPGSGNRGEDERRLDALQEITRAFLSLGKPVVAAVQGYALGSGCEWAMNCDLIVAASGAKFGFPETRLGTAVGNAGTKLLPLIVGLQRAREMILTNRIIDAEEAYRWGLVNRVVPEASLLHAAVATARRLAQNPPLANRLARTGIHEALGLDLHRTLELEREALWSAGHGRESVPSRAPPHRA
ncbi:MAG: enoyl-CoA hydratase/isomerase family protein [Deltaproteobacteria bacterium]|nr:enoyl-CoA hydratase/isomerase family protein [Deltaproteobacteria bacterium]